MCWRLGIRKSGSDVGEGMDPWKESSCIVIGEWEFYW